QVGLKLRFEVLPPRGGGDRQRHLPGIAALLPHPTGAGPGRRCPHRPPFEQRGPDAGAGQMVGDGTADHATTDHDHLRWRTGHPALSLKFPVISAPYSWPAAPRAFPCTVAPLFAPSFARNVARFGAGSSELLAVWRDPRSGRT